MNERTAGDCSPKDETPRSGTRAIVWLASAVAVGTLATLLAANVGAPRASAAPPTARPIDPLVELLGASPTCRSPSPEAALHLAELLAERGHAKAESARVRVADGPRAVHELGEAAECFEVAGQSDRAARLRSEERKLREHIEGVVRAHRLRLDRARESAQPSAALTEIKALRTLFEGSHGAYAQWLASEERRLREADKP